MPVEIFDACTYRADEMINTLKKILKKDEKPQADRALLAPPSVLQRTSSNFEAAICRQFGAKLVEGITDATNKMYAEYAVNSIERGRKAVRKIEQFAPVQGKDVLDVGCAFCGFLLACREKGAKTLRGIDIDPYLIKLGVLQLKDYSCQAEILTCDILNERLLPELGTFDVIFCNDVIEHVADPQRCIRNMAGLLNPGGLLFIEVPNYHSLDMVLSDCHFNLFCITPLQRSLADAYHQQHFPRAYDVGFYAPLSYYVYVTGYHGLMVKIQTFNDPDQDNVEDVLSPLDSKAALLRSRLDRFTLDDCKGDQALYDAIVHTCNTIYRDYSERSALLRALTDAVERKILLTDLLLTYGESCWTIIGQKRSGNSTA